MGKYKLWMSDIAFNGEEIFFSAGQFNGLFKVNLRDGKADFIASFPKESRLQARLHSVAIKYKDEIIFLPDLSNYITIYNIRNNDFDNIEYPIKNRNEMMQYCPKIVSGILIGSCVYAFSAKDPCIICYDFEAKRLKVYNEWFEEFKMYGYRENTSFFCRDICQIGNSIFARTYQNNVIVEYNIKSEKITFHHVENQTSVVLCSDIDKVWLLEENGINIYTWDSQNCLLENMGLENNLESMGKKYQCSIKLQDEIWFFPFLHNSILIMDKTSKKLKIKNMFMINEDKRYENNLLGSVWFRKVYDDKLYFMSVLENKMYCFTDSDNKILCTDIYVNRTDINRYLFQEKKINSFRGVMQEEDSLWGNTLKIDDFLDMIILYKSDKLKQEKNRGKIGTEIHKLCCIAKGE